MWTEKARGEGADSLACKRTLRRWMRLGLAGGSSLAAAGAGTLLILVPPAAATTSGYTNLMSPATLGTTNENCPTSFLAGANNPKVIKSHTGSTVAGGTVHYTITFSPAEPATFNIRDCMFLADASGNPLSKFDEAQFNNVAPGPTFTYDYVLPGTLPVGDQLCNVAKTEQVVNKTVKDRKTNIDCFVITAPPAPTNPPPTGGGSTTTGGPTPSIATGTNKTVPGVTTVHTGMPWAGSRPFELAVVGAGIAMMGAGTLLRRRIRRA